MSKHRSERPVWWWHQRILGHTQRQWGVLRPMGVRPARGSVLVCECGKRFRA